MGGERDEPERASSLFALDWSVPEVPSADLELRGLRDWRTSEPAIEIHLEPPEDLRSLRPQKGSTHNLPAPLNRFVGRDREMAEVAKLLATSRLVTLTGAAGIGKTRLALQAAANLAEDYPDGVWLVDLTRLSDPAQVPKAVALALSLHDNPACSPIECLINYLRCRQPLLILDNCEHVIEAAAELAEALLRGCPSLQILATSREALGIAGEAPWVVPPMSLPHPRERALPGQPAASEAVRLFCERVVAPNFVLTPAVAPAVGEICRRLDGIPLAIELAAARVGVLSPAQIAARLDDRFSLLTSGSRTALPRHRTLLAALQWSHDLLSVDERVLLRRLSVFHGGFTLEAAEEVCSGGEVRRRQVLGTLTQLVTKSLVVADAGGSEARYRLLETIWEYATERLAGSGEETALRAAHARWCLHLVEQAGPELAGSRQAECCERLEAESPNIVSALDWSLERESELTLRIASAMTLFWSVGGHPVEGRTWLERAWSKSADEASLALRAKARWGIGFLAFMLGDLDAALLAGQESLVLSARIGDTQGCARSLHLLGQAVTHFRDSTQARPLLEESVLLARQVGDAWCLAGSLAVLGVGELYDGNLAAARVPFEECVAVARRAGNPQRLAGGLLGLACADLEEGRYDAAQMSLEEAWPIARELAGMSYLTALALVGLGELASARGNFSRGLALMTEGVALHHEARLRPFLPLCLNFLGRALLAGGDPVAARPPFQEALSLSREAGRERNEALALLGLGEIAVILRGARVGGPIIHEALAVARKSGHRLVIGRSLHALGKLARSEGKFEDAWSLHHEALGLQADTGLRPGVIASLEALAGLAAEQGRFPYAARLFGAAQAWRDANGPVRPPIDQPRHDADVAVVKGAISSEELEAAWEEGEGLPLEGAVAYARRGRGPRRRPSAGWASLTSAERRVAELVAEGLTNPEIAERLFITSRTVRAHVSSALAKLSFSSRKEIVREAARRGA